MMFNFNFIRTPSLEQSSPKTKLFHFKFMRNFHCSFGNNCNAESCAWFKKIIELRIFS